MGRKKGFRGDEAILLALYEAGKELSREEVMERTGLNWTAVRYWLGDPENPNNLVARGCVEEVRVVDKTLNRAQVMYKYRLKNPECVYRVLNNRQNNRE